MGYFPFYMDISGKKCLVIGGGTVALRKIEKLIDFKPEIIVIAPEICPEIEKFPVQRIYCEFQDSDIDGAFMVITATDNRELNRHIFEVCTERKIPVNTVDDKEKCSFIFPSLVHKGDITIGISTGGTSPVMAKFLRKVIEDEFDDIYLEWAGVLSRYRPVVREMFDTEKKRKEANEAILDMCMIYGNMPTEEDIIHLLEAIKKNEN